MTLACSNYYELPEKTMIGGDYKELYWKLRDMERGGYLDCHNLSMRFALIEYSNRSENPRVLKEGLVVDNDDGSTEFKVILETHDTEELFGKYIYQITIEASEEKQQSFQGIFNILKNNIKPEEDSIQI